MHIDSPLLADWTPEHKENLKHLVEAVDAGVYGPLIWVGSSRWSTGGNSKDVRGVSAWALDGLQLVPEKGVLKRKAGEPIWLRYSSLAEIGFELLGVGPIVLGCTAQVSDGAGRREGLMVHFNDKMDVATAALIERAVRR